MTETRRRRPTQVPRGVALFNGIVRALLAAGLPMGPDVLLTVRGRKTGLPRSTPVAVAEISGRLWLLSPFGETDWARNLRAATRATIRSGRDRYEVSARELDQGERIAFYRDVLDPYLETHRFAAWIVRNLDRIGPDPVEAAAGRPIFELQRVPRGAR